MGKKSLCLLISCALLSYFVYTPLPDNIEQPWKLMITWAVIRCGASLSGILEILGFPPYAVGYFFQVPPTSDANVTVTDTLFNKVPVRVFEPKQKSSTMRRAVFYIHGGGWTAGDARWITYDDLARQMVNKLDAVVISTNYRLSPQYHFPTQFEDVYDALRWFLRKKVLEEYGVDPARICVAGDSAGGNLAAGTTQKLLDDPEVKIKVKIQSLIYPALQTLDMDLPSYRENAYIPILLKYDMVLFWSLYFTSDKVLREAMLANQHTPVESNHLFKFVNWSTLLPERFQKGHLYTSPMHGPADLAKKFPGFLDVRASSLLADDSKLQGLPLTHILTCQYDVLRDDGLMYVSRLRAAGVQVVHEHVEDGFHGILSFSMSFKAGQRELNKYLKWLEENL
ncbi:arylacetamide deacetylase-like isoform X2 [Phascolarctos cinereus]|uniref:Arylacetamide deacetylase-like isoform X3 n=1 Tax=Phascolarctos cinereus TaxID=38626 RepID=A0A6P5KI01_PHACI|nr:arylacetamide deacetylase-like isoform X3 [Phascolarctos cinereus]